MARTAPAPNIPAIPGMNPGAFVMGGGGSGGSGSGGSGSGGSGQQGAGGEAGGEGAEGGGANAATCGPSTGGGCPNPAHGTAGTAAGDPVDPISGRVYTVAEIDLALPAPLPLVLERSYSSAACNEDTDLGFGWNHSLGWAIQEGRRTIKVINPSAGPLEARRPTEGQSSLLGCGRLTRHPWGYALESGRVVRTFAIQHRRRWLLTRIMDAHRNAIILSYEGTRLSGMVDSAGRAIRVRRLGDGHIEAFEVYDAERSSWRSFRRYLYDERGDMVAATDPAGHATRFGYDEDHRLVRKTSPGGLTAEFRYDAHGRCHESWCHWAGREALDESAPPVLVDGTRAKGMLHVRIDYGDGYSEVVTSRAIRKIEGNQLERPDKLVFAGGVHTYAYDAAGNMIEYADALGHTWSYERSERGLVVGQTDPLGARTEYEHDEQGQVVEARNAEAETTRYTRTPTGKVLAIDDDLGRVAAFEYDARGLLSGATMPDGAATKMSYDMLGNRVEVVEPEGSRRRIQHDYLGRVTGLTDELGRQTHYRYDDCQQLVAVTGPGGSTASRGYDGDGNLVRMTDAEGRSTELRWGNYRQVSEIVRPDGRSVSFRYDREGDLVSIVNERGEHHRFERDSEGRIVAEHTFDGRSIHYAHDLVGRIVQRRSDGALTEYVYDPHGRLLKRLYADDTADTFEYDLVGRMVSAESADVRIEYSYDRRGRLTKETQTGPMGTVTSDYSHDDADRVTRVVGPAGELEVRRDAMGRPVEIHYGDVAPMSIRRDARGYELERSLPRGGRVETHWSPDALLAQRSLFARGGALDPNEPEWIGAKGQRELVRTSYVWSPAGDLAAIERLAHQATKPERTEHDFDANGRIVERRRDMVALEALGHGAGGEIHERAQPRGYQPGARVTARGATRYSYDDRGRLVEKRTQGEHGERVWGFSWRESGLLSSIDTPDRERITFLYDCFARRVLKRIDARDRVVSRTSYDWDGDVMVRERRESLGPGADPVVEERRYAAIPGEALPFAQRLTHGSGDDEVQHLVYDQVGFPVALLEGDGSVAAETRPSLYGGIDPRLADATTLRFLGQHADLETGLYYHRHRYYDPETGSFISPEPVGIAGSLMSYAFADNYPAWLIDPDGLARTTVDRTPPLAPVTARSGSRGAGIPIHPAVAASLPPNNARPPNSGGEPADCGEPRALSRHLHDWEARNAGPPPSLCNPPDQNWQSNLQSALGEVHNIESEHRGEAIPPCENCSQTIPRLWNLAGMPPPYGVTALPGTPPPAGWDHAANAGQSPVAPPHGPFNDPATGTPVMPGSWGAEGRP